MEDLYKDDPNSWLRRTRFSKTVYHQPNPLHIPIIPLTKLKLGSSNPSSNQASISEPVTWENTSKITQTTTLSSLKLNLTKENNLAFINGVISNMFKEVKNTVRSQFMVPQHGERTVKSSSNQKKKSRWMKYFDREVRQVGVLVKSSEVRDDPVEEDGEQGLLPNFKKATCRATRVWP